MHQKHCSYHWDMNVMIQAINMFNHDFIGNLFNFLDKLLTNETFLPDSLINLYMNLIAVV